MLHKKLLTLALGVGLTASAATTQASVVLNNWSFNPDGGGLAGSTQINEYIDLTGNAFIKINPTSPSAFNFTEFGVFKAIGNDGFGDFSAYTNNITATFDASGSGLFSGTFGFNTGLLNVYADAVNNYGTTTGTYGADDGTLIAQFAVYGGGGLVDGSGNPVTNGQITVYAQAVSGTVLSGYFLDPAGNDMSSQDFLAFAFTNANAISSPTTTMVSEIICQGAGFAGAGCPTGSGYSNTPGDHIFIANNGQFKVAVVPEPATLALLGLGLLGMGASIRRRKTA